MGKALDLRVQKTYISLTNTFLNLLKTKRFEDISVNELCDKAMVRRATFYKHFGDKYEFFTFVVREIQLSFNEKLQQTHNSQKPHEFYIYVIQNLFDFLNENEKLVYSVINSSAFPLLLEILSEQIALDICGHLKDDKQNGKEMPLLPELMATAFTGALINIGRWWINHKEKMSKDEMTSCLSVYVDKLWSSAFL